MATIKFRAKIEHPRYVDGTDAPARIKVPTLRRHHCDMAGFRSHPKYGALANSDMFEANVLSRIKRDRLGDYVRLDRVPDGVSIADGTFLATVTVEV